MKNILLLAGLLMAMSVQAQKPATPNNNAPASAKNFNTRKIETLLKKTSYQLEKLDSNIWTIPFKGNNKEELKVVITESEGLTIFFCIVREKGSETIPADKRLEVLKYNMDFDRVKIGIDDDDNLMVRIDISTRITDQKELEINIEQIAAAADELYGLLFK
jgi:hypothetical protein